MSNSLKFQLKNIYFSSDSGRWIQAGANRLGNETYVLDEFHLNKYLHKNAGKFPKDTNLIFNYLKFCIAENVKELFKQSLADLKKIEELEKFLFRVLMVCWVEMPLEEELLWKIIF